MTQLARAGQVVDEFDRPVPGASIYVYNIDGTDASITSDGITQITQPLSTDEFGNYSYYAVVGYYREDTWYGGKLRYRENSIAIGSPGADLTLRTDLAATTGSALIGTTSGKTLQEQVFGADLGPIPDGVQNDKTVLRKFVGVGSSSGLYGENNQVVGYGSGAIGTLRAAYFGGITEASATCDLLEGIHCFAWLRGTGNVTTFKVIEAHPVIGVDSSQNPIVGSGNVTADCMVYNTAGLVLGNITLPKIIGYNASQLSDGTHGGIVTASYGFNAEHTQAATETVGYRSQQRKVTGAWSFLANSNDGSEAAPAGLGGSLKVGWNGDTTISAPAYRLDVLAAADDYSARVANRTGVSPFGLKIEYTFAAPNDSGHDFIHCLDTGATRFQVASNGIVSIAGTPVLGPQRPGWTAPTGTQTRTTFATSTVTLPQLAEHVYALINDLIAHGIIGA